MSSLRDHRQRAGRSQQDLADDVGLVQRFGSALQLNSGS
jgi:hypothetical protein